MQGPGRGARRRRWTLTSLLAALTLAQACHRDAYSAERPYEEELRHDATGAVRARLFAERQDERDALAGILTSGPHREPIHDERVLAAIRHVPRHAFVAPRHRQRAYMDRAMPIEHGQTISEPYVVAYMTELLQLAPGKKVLEIGTGSAYQAAVLAELTPEVYSIEIILGLGKQAAERLKLLGYGTVRTRVGDGYYGWQEAAPFDAIIVTAAAGHVPPPLLSQLAKGGRMVIPVGDPYSVQRLILVTKDADGNVKTEDRVPVRFVPMTGAAQGRAASGE